MVNALVAMFEMMRRDRARAAPHVQALLGLAHEHRMPDWIAYGTFAEGWLRWGGRDREAGMQEMQEGVALMNLQQRGSFLPLFMTLLAETEAEAGRLEAGLSNVDRQLAAIERTGQNWYTAELYRVRGEILLKCRSSGMRPQQKPLLREQSTLLKANPQKCSNSKPP